MPLVRGNYSKKNSFIFSYLSCRLLETLLIGRFKEDFGKHERKIISVFGPAILSVKSGSIRKVFEM